MIILLNNFQKAFSNATQRVRDAKGLAPRPKKKKAKLEKPPVSTDEDDENKGEKQKVIRKRVRRTISSSDDDLIEKSKENSAPNLELAAFKGADKQDKEADKQVNEADQDAGSAQGTSKQQVQWVLDMFIITL